MKTSLLALLSLLLLLASCASERTVLWTIASEKADCVGEAPQQCLIIKRGKNAPNWEYFYDQIAGFNYQGGYEYVLQIRERKGRNAPADAFVRSYSLVKEISKTETQSTNLPILSRAVE